MSNGIRFVNIGFGSLVNAGRIIAVVSADSAPVKRLLRDAEDRNQLVDATFGRKVRTVLVMDSDVPPSDEYFTAFSRSSCVASATLDTVSGSLSIFL